MYLEDISSEIITSPNNKIDCKHTSVFLAGGISKCKDWQSKVIEELKYDDITIFNPRRKEFDVNNKSAAYDQIHWEFDRLEKADIFSMYFCNSESDQPICMYELGRYISRMQCKYPTDWRNRVVISIEEGYKRSLDVIAQVNLCAPRLFVDTRATPESHAFIIRNCVRRLKHGIPREDR